MIISANNLATLNLRAFGTIEHKDGEEGRLHREKRATSSGLWVFPCRLEARYIHPLYSSQDQSIMATNRLTWHQSPPGSHEFLWHFQ